MITIVLITAGKGFDILSALKPTPLASLHCPFQPLGGHYMCPCFVGRYLLALINNNFLFVKKSAEYIIMKLTDSTHVNFSNQKVLSMRDLIFMFCETLSLLRLLVLCHLGIQSKYQIQNNYLASLHFSNPHFSNQPISSKTSYS